VTNNGALAGNAQTADTLLRMRAIDACGYCHVAAGNTVDNDPVYNGTWPASSNDGHNLASPPCGECHASVHGAGAETTIPALNGLLLKGKDTNANLVFAYENLDKNSSALERITAVQAVASAQGFGNAVTGFTVAQYSTTLFTDPTGPAVRQQAVGIFCAGCHDGAYNSTTAGAAVSFSNSPVGAAGGLYAGHRTMATNTSSWNSLGNARSSGQSNAGAGFTVAFAPATDCRSCHDADNGFNNGKSAFPHAWGYVAGTGPQTAAAGAIFGGPNPNGAIVAGTPTYVWLLSAAYAGAPKANVGANNHVGAGGGTLQDGVCLKCHRGVGGASGVGINF
jgi:cytochrome c553